MSAVYKMLLKHKYKTPNNKLYLGNLSLKSHRVRKDVGREGGQNQDETEEGESTGKTTLKIVSERIPEWSRHSV